MSTLDETLATRQCLSEYHVYHESHQNISITPFLNKKKEFGYNRRDEGDQEDAEVGEDVGEACVWVRNGLLVDLFDVEGYVCGSGNERLPRGNFTGP